MLLVFLTFIILMLCQIVDAQISQHQPPGPHYQSATYCKGCHESIYQYWQKSMHSYAVEDPIFHHSFEEAQKKYGLQIRRFCLSCHSPTTMLSLDFELKNPLSREGVTCDFCHTVTDVVHKQPQNAFEVQLGDTKFGPWSGIAPIGQLTFQYSQLQTEAKLCSGCHELHSKTGVKVLSTYSEWEDSIYAQKGIQCQNCHMPETLDVFVNADIRATNRLAHAHDFRGGHSRIQLENAASIVVTERQDATKLLADVYVTNEEAGHSLPTGIPTRRVVLLVSLKDQDGKPVAMQRRQYQKILLDEKRVRITTAEAMLLEAAVLESDNRIKPKETRHEQFVFDPVDRSKGYLLAVELNYELPVTSPEPNLMLVEIAKVEKVLEPFKDAGIDFKMLVLVISTLLLAIILAFVLKNHLFANGG